MVNKMILHKKVLLFLMLLFPWYNAHGAELGIPLISQRHYVACGVDADYNYLARKQEGYWTGFDVDMCRAVAQAVLQNSESFKLIPVKPANIGKMLNTGAIDIMFGHNALPPQIEAQQNISAVDVMYYDKIVFAVRNPKDNASSMKEYASENVCVQDKSADFDFLKQYNAKYALGFNFVKFPSKTAVKEAFYLKRCNLVVGDEVFIKSIVKDLKSGNAEVLPEEISLIGVKSYTAGSNNRFNTAMRAIFNAIKSASALNISAVNIEAFKSDATPSVQNMLGVNPQIWQKLGLAPDWMISYISQFGGYSEIIDRNLGYASPLSIDTSRNEPYGKGGMIIATPLL